MLSSPTGNIIRTPTGDIIVIGDTQVIHKSPTDHFLALAKYIWKHRPAHIVHIGDHWDFESLSFYATQEEKEGRRLVDDIQSGYKALKIVTDYLNEQNAIQKKKKYTPTLDFITGNHENRLARMVGAQPHLIGLIDLEGMVKRLGWTVHSFLDPLWIGDVCFNHFMPNAMTGRAVGGSIENKMNKFPHSFVHGHQQQFQFARRQNLQGKPHFGACAGSFYMHDEPYRGACNTEIRGFLHLKPFRNRFDYLDHDVEFVSLERLLGSY